MIAAGKKEIWTARLEHPVRVQLGGLECQRPVLPEPPRWNRS